MKQLYSIETADQLLKLQSAGNRLFQKLMTYKETIHSEYGLTETPKAVMWTTGELAMETFSKIPIPAFTSRNMIMMSPDIEEWKQLFLKQLEDKQLPDIRSFYQGLSEEHILVILAHELTHHIDLFPVEFEEYGESIWFEEGMCFYLPRKLLLNQEEFDEITQTEEVLVEIFKEKYGQHDLEEFGSGSYEGSLTSIMYDYWRSYLRVKHLVETVAGGDIHQVFRWYNEWHSSKQEVSFSRYLNRIVNVDISKVHD